MSLEEFSNQYFEGDINKSIGVLAHEIYSRDFQYTKSRENCLYLMNQLDKEQKNIYADFLADEINKNPDSFVKDVNNAQNILNLNLTYEEIQNATVNPYKAKLGKSFFKLLIGNAGILAFMIVANSVGQTDLASKLGAGAMTLFNSYVALDVSSNIMNYFRFKKAKKFVDNNEMEKNELESNVEIGGRRL